MLALDKTGTITTGAPAVTAVTPVSPALASELLRIGGRLGASSLHPLARAVAGHAATQNIDITLPDSSRTVPGLGTIGTVDNHDYFVGSLRLAREVSKLSPQAEQVLASAGAEGQSIVVVGHQSHGECRGEVIGVISLMDSLRPEVPAVVARLHALGIRTEVLSGDAEPAVRAVAQQAGIAGASAGLLPADKASRITALRLAGGSTGMVGDGVNDAPAMAAASVGIAMGAAGSDTVLETADVALMTDDLRGIPDAIVMGRRTLNIILANVVVAIGLKVVFLLLTLAGHASMWLAILADTGATLLVIANSLRLLRA